MIPVWALSVMTTVADQVLSFLQARDRAQGWSSVELCEKLELEPRDVSRTYHHHTEKLMRWGGKEGPDSKEAEQAAAAASKLLVNEPKVSGGQPYRYRYRLAREGLGQANRDKHRENLCPHKSAPHHARGMCIACYQRWIKQQQPVTRDSQDELDRPSKQRRVATGSEMDSIACTACRRRDGEDSMVLCDGCDDAWHIYCMLPKRHEVPPPQHSDLTC